MLNTWFGNLRNKLMSRKAPVKRSGRDSARTFRPRLEALEDRTLLAASLLPATPALTGPGGSLAGLTPTVTWNAAANDATYELYLQNTSNGQVSDLTKLTGTSYTPASSLTAGNYQAWLRAFSSDGTASGWSAADPFTLLGSLPGQSAVTGPWGSITNLTPTITWNAAVNASTYELYLLDASTNQGTDLTKLSGTSYTPPSSLVLGSYQVWERLQQRRAGRLQRSGELRRHACDARNADADRADRLACRTDADRHLECGRQ